MKICPNVRKGTLGQNQVLFKTQNIMSKSLSTVMHVVYMGNQDVLVCFLMFLFCNAKIWDEVDFDVAVRIAI